MIYIIDLAMSFLYLDSAGQKISPCECTTSLDIYRVTVQCVRWSYAIVRMSRDSGHCGQEVKEQGGFLNLDSLARCITNMEAEYQKVEELERLVACLSHSSECRDHECMVTSCYRMKEVVVHTKTCVLCGCQVCAQLVALCCYHAQLCRDVRCGIEYCANIKNKLAELETMMGTNKNIN